jgi:hypothetical protein
MKAATGIKFVFTDNTCKDCIVLKCFGVETKQEPQLSYYSGILYCYELVLKFCIITNKFADEKHFVLHNIGCFVTIKCPN